MATQPTVYIERHGTLHAIQSATMFHDLGYQWSQLHVVGQLPAPVGSPVQLFKLATGSTVYLYQGGTLHWIPSEQVFYARGYQWDNVYDVAKLPAVIGSPVSQSSVLPQQAVIMSGFPYVPLNGTKTFVVDALNKMGQFNSTYGGTSTVKILQNQGQLSVYNGSTWVRSGTVPVHFSHGQAMLSVKAGSTAWRGIVLQPAAQSSPAGGDSNEIANIPNTTTGQVGWRVYTAQKKPVSGKNPVYPSSSAQQFLLEPVNAQGQIVAGTLADGVGMVVDPALAYCPGGTVPGEQPVCNEIGPYYTSGSALAFHYSGQGYFSPRTPIVFKVLPASPTQGLVTRVTTLSSHTSLAVSTPTIFSQTSSPSHPSDTMIQTVSGVKPDTQYTIQSQLFYAKGQPLEGLAMLLHFSGTNDLPMVVNSSARTTPSTFSHETMGNKYISVTYKSGSASTVPDVISGFGGVTLITNAF